LTGDVMEDSKFNICELQIVYANMEIS